MGTGGKHNKMSHCLKALHCELVKVVPQSNNVACIYEYIMAKPQVKEH